MSVFQVRPVQIADTPALQQRCWPQQTLPQVAARLEELVRSRNPQSRWGAVAVSENTSVGYGQLSRWGSRAEICNLIVAEAWRGQGAGTALIQWLIALAQEKQFPTVEIGAAEANPRAFVLYRRLGFQMDRSLTLDVGNGPEPVLYLSLDLQPVVRTE
jgi:ribosomal protein S18 acetylase RimI-like enzyme